MIEELGKRLLYRAAKELEEGRIMIPLALRSWFRPMKGGSKIFLAKTIFPRR